jgi:putative tricarboxylic transport membrane protein
MIERLVALALLLASGVYLANALPLPMGTMARPGPGFYPVAVGVLASVVALVWVAASYRRVPAAAGPTVPDAAARVRVVSTAAVLVMFCAVLPWVGYPVAACLFVVLMLRVLGAGWLAAGATAAAAAGVSYYVFGKLLGVPLPPGALFD